MTRAEERAEEYCKKMNYLNDVRDKQDDGTLYHSLEADTAIDAYVTAYKQAEKDLALTWEDIKELDGIMDSMRTYTAWDAVNYPNDEDFYKEVLKRFNEIDTK